MLEHFFSQQYEQALVEQLREQVNNVMAALQLLTPMIQMQGEEKYRNYLAVANQSLYRLLRLMGNVEFAQKVQQGAQDALFHPAAMDMAGLCRTMCRQVEALAAKARVSFRYEEDKGNVLMCGDAALLRRMLLNLIARAIQAAGPGGQAGLRLNMDGDTVMLTVWNVAGDHAGQPLRPIEGDGEVDDLGLAVARHIAAAHQGRIVFEEQEQGGRLVAAIPVGAFLQEHSLHTPRLSYDPMGGFSPLLIELADALPYQAFTPEDIE